MSDLFFYVETKKGVYPINSSLTIAKTSEFFDKDGNEFETPTNGKECIYKEFYVIRYNYCDIAKFDTEKEAQDVMEKIQTAINDCQKYYFINENE